MEWLLLGCLGRVVKGRVLLCECAELVHEPAGSRRAELCLAPLVPEAAWGEEAGGVFSSCAAVDVKEGADRPVLVVLAVGPLEVVVQVGRQVLGVFLGPEAGQGEAVALAGEAELAGQQQVTQDVAEVLTAVEARSPPACAGRALATSPSAPSCRSTHLPSPWLLRET